MLPDPCPLPTPVFPKVRRTHRPRWGRSLWHRTDERTSSASGGQAARTASAFTARLCLAMRLELKGEVSTEAGYFSFGEICVADKPACIRSPGRPPVYSYHDLGEQQACVTVGCEVSRNENIRIEYSDGFRREVCFPEGTALDVMHTTQPISDKWFDQSGNEVAPPAEERPIRKFFLPPPPGHEGFWPW